jgi:STE24 endopeptidase
MALDGLVDSSQYPSRHPSKAKTYNRMKLFTGLVSSAISVAFLCALVMTNGSIVLEEWAADWSNSAIGRVALFGVILGLMQMVVTVPLRFYTGYGIEHRFGLSRQSLGQWAWENTKAMILGGTIGLSFLLLLYVCILEFGLFWWGPVGILWFVASILVARVAPVILFPLFYDFTPLEEGRLKERILEVCLKARVHVEGVFSFNLSKNTTKVNAGFAGLGRSRRIILGDTLLKEFSEEEIETVFAHEVGHYAGRHIVRSLIVEGIMTMGGLAMAASLYSSSIEWFGFETISQLAALPLVILWIAVLGMVTRPIGNLVSRHFERQADEFAVRSTGKTEAFVSALRKLAVTNLADPTPHPLVEFFFYSHPSLDRRIRAVQALRS